MLLTDEMVSALWTGKCRREIKKKKKRVLES